MWSSRTSAMRLLTPPRMLARSISTSAQSSPEERDLSMESTCPRMRRMRATSFCFSFSRCDIFSFLLYPRGIWYEVQQLVQARCWPALGAGRCCRVARLQSAELMTDSGVRSFLIFSVVHVTGDLCVFLLRLSV